MHIHGAWAGALIRAILGTCVMLSPLGCSPFRYTGPPLTPIHGPPPKYAAVTVGLDHACGLTTAGTAFCWGNNNLGQVGAGFFSAVVTRPTAVAGGHTFAMLSAGSGFTCGIGSGGDVLCWGANGLGELGSGALGGTKNTPTAVVFGESMGPNDSGPFRSVTAGPRSACAITVNGFAYCWGSNYQGALGVGTKVTALADSNSNSGVALRLNTNDTFQTISIGNQVACGVTATGAVDCWGSNLTDQLDSAFVPDTCHFLSVFPPSPANAFPCALSPSRVSLPAAAQMVSVSPGNYVCALLNTLQTFCWGEFQSDVLGADQSGVPIVPPVCHFNDGGSGPCSWTPILAGIKNATQISMGFDFACAATGPAGAPIVCWGAQDNGRLGDGVVAHALRAVAAPTSVPLTGNVQVGGGFACVATGAGVPVGVPTAVSTVPQNAIFCWGIANDATGRLGVGPGPSAVPKRILEP